MSDPLPLNTPVTIARFKHSGYRGHVIERDACDRFYRLQVTHDPTGRRLPEPFVHGLYARAELHPR